MDIFFWPKHVPGKHVPRHVPVRYMLGHMLKHVPQNRHHER